MVGGYPGQGPVTMGVEVASERALNVRISDHLMETDGSYPYRKKARWTGEIESDGTRRRSTKPRC